MGKIPSLLKKGWSFLAYGAAAGLIVSGCATLPENQVAEEKAKPPIIQSLEVRPSLDQVVVEFITSETAPYTAFRLLDPPRIVLDIRGDLAESLPREKNVYAAGVTNIQMEEGKTQPMSSRAVINAYQPVDFNVKSSDKVITVTITSQKDAPPPLETVQKAPSETAGKEPVTPHDPRIFFKDRPGHLTQILGLDFTLLDQGKSRLIVTTDKKARYDLDQKSPKRIVLNFPQATIPPLIMRHMDSKYFEGAVELVKASVSPGDQGVSIAVSLREMVPFHVKQSETELTIDFGSTSIRPQEKRIVPLKQAQALGPVASMQIQKQSVAGPGKPVGVVGNMAVVPDKQGQPVIVKPIELEDPRAPKVYTGARMTMDFVNADVTNVLRLIGEVSNLNIVWGADVRGTVSMRLKDVPWDQALDLVLENNNLGKRQSANVMWIAPKSAIQQLEKAEKDKIDEYNKRLEAQKKQREEEKKQEPMVTEYIPVDFAKAEDIKPLLKAGIGFPLGPDEVELDEESGRYRKISTDARTNTIILTDLVSNVQKAKDVVKQFDTPVKQVMIEARIVDATDDFSRDLGLRWDNLQIQKRNEGGNFTSWTPTPPSPSDPTGFASGGRLTSPGFTSNSPSAWEPNLGLVFSKLSGSGLTATVLDAKLALSEAEGKTKIISAPKVIATNGQTAMISRGDSIIIPATENVASEQLDATLSLEVTPTVSYNNYISLDVKVTDDNAPSNVRILKKSVSTKLMIRSGDTVVIGGIYTENESLNEDGIPGVRRLPLLGWLFKARSTSLQKTELLIFLTPTVLPTLAAR
ncbi:MAG: type IV pilus secretin PilQ [Deltaproteobacteria bacterium]|nr:type IV pilus secretin PilQ [Deltaproteobacteria bacterium]